MRRLRPLLIILAGLLIGFALIRTLFAEQIGAALFRHAAVQGAARSALTGLPDGLHVVLVGTGSPLADPTRAGPMTAVIAGERIFVVDAGGGTVRNYQSMGLPLDRLDGVLLTHFHSDHIDGLGELLIQAWAGGGRASPLPVYGPQGIGQIVDGLKTVYAQDAAYRVAHHGADYLDPAGQGGRALAFDATLGTVRVMDEGGLVITAVPVNHAPAAPAVAYRFDYGGRSVTVSGDTAKSDALAALARGTDVLVHEALNAEFTGAVSGALEKAGRGRLAKIIADTPSYHSTPVEAAQTASAAEARLLVLSHIVPALPSRFLHAAYLKGARDVYAGPMMVGEDGMMFSLPANSTDVKRSRLNP